MKPVAIFRQSPAEGPGYLSTFLDSHHIPWQLIKIDAGEDPPSTINQFSGLVFMGGSMSVNDDLPWIGSELKLIRQAVSSDIPLLGHCFGGQLISKALGGVVSRSKVKEIGWGKVRVTNNTIARQWFDYPLEFDSFHWHSEIFTLPDSATQLLSSNYCENQAFSMGIHFGMQCHVEVTEKMIEHWYAIGINEIANSSGPGVQSSESVHIDITQRVLQLHVIAKRLYANWILGLKR